jgi:hypothetical protein
VHDVEEVDSLSPFREHEAGLSELILDDHVLRGVDNVFLLEIKDQVALFVLLRISVREPFDFIVLAVLKGAFYVAEPVGDLYLSFGFDDVDLLLADAEEIGFVGEKADLFIVRYGDGHFDF